MGRDLRSTSTDNRKTLQDRSSNGPIVTYETRTHMMAAHMASPASRDPRLLTGPGPARASPKDREACIHTHTSPPTMMRPGLHLFIRVLQRRDANHGRDRSPL
ncbi:hypothetical protein MN608_08340 [Microdochium nivale]|nr:hypothetical protein MN608_08340 [Microdochium nivale]